MGGKCCSQRAKPPSASGSNVGTDVVVTGPRREMMVKNALETEQRLHKMRGAIVLEADQLQADGQYGEDRAQEVARLKAEAEAAAQVKARLTEIRTMACDLLKTSSDEETGSDDCSDDTEEEEAAQWTSEVAQLKAEEAAAQFKAEGEVVRSKAVKAAARLKAEEIRKTVFNLLESSSDSDQADDSDQANDSDAVAATEVEGVATLQTEGEIEEKAAQLKAEETVAQLKAEEQAAQLKAEETVAQLKAEEQAAQLKAEEQAAQLKAEEQAAQLKATEQAAQLKAEEQAAQLKATEQAAQLKAQEHFRLQALDLLESSSDADEGEEPQTEEGVASAKPGLDSVEQAAASKAEEEHATAVGVSKIESLAESMLETSSEEYSSGEDV